MATINDELKKFFELMDFAITKHNPSYGNSWKEMPIGHLEQRLKNKLTEFDLTKNASKLISVANLAALLYLRLEGSKND